MRLFQAPLDTCLDSPLVASLSVHGLHFTVCAASIRDRQKCGGMQSKMFADFRPSISRGEGCKKLHKIILDLFLFHSAPNKVLSLLQFKELGGPRILASHLKKKKNQKNPRAHKNKIGTSPPPPTTPPPQKGEFYGHSFSCRKNAFFPGVHKIGAPISDPRMADTNFTTDTRIFLKKFRSHQ